MEISKVEEAVLGAILIDSKCIHIVADKLGEHLFISQSNKIICKHILELYNQRKAIDLITLTSSLRNSSELDKIGGAYTIAAATNRTTSSANIEFHIAILAQNYMKREVQTIGQKYSTLASVDVQDIFNLTSSFEKDVSGITAKIISKGVANAEKVSKEFIEHLENEVINDGLPTPINQLDELLGGWQKSDLVIIAARPGMGKSSLAISIANTAAFEAAKSVAIFSLEMPTRQVAQRIFSIKSGVDYSKVRNREFNSMEKDILLRVNEDFKQTKYFIDDTAGIKLNELRAKCIKLQRSEGLDMVIIDYIQLMRLGYKVGNREQEVSEITKGLKELAKELDVPVIALAQLNRDVEQRSNKRPQLSDLRESGSIEQDADIVMFVMRPEYYDFHEFENESTDGLALILVDKHRNGATKDLKAYFNKNTMEFTNIYGP